MNPAFSKCTDLRIVSYRTHPEEYVGYFGKCSCEGLRMPSGEHTEEKSHKINSKNKSKESRWMKQQARKIHNMGKKYYKNKVKNHFILKTYIDKPLSGLIKTKETMNKRDVIITDEV